MSNAVVSIHALTKVYNRKAVVHNLSAELKKGTLVGLVGPNGAGKSTLTHLIAGVIRPTSGSILLRISGPEKLAWVSQMTTMDWYLTAFHNVRLGARLGGLSWCESSKEAHRAMEVLGIAEHKHVDVEILSGGQQKKVQVARALAQQADVLLLDEPTVGLDYKTCTEFIAHLRSLTNQGKTVLIASHDLTFLEKHIDHIWLLDNGMLKIAQDVSELLAERKPKTISELVIDYHGTLDSSFLLALQATNGVSLIREKPLHVKFDVGTDTKPLLESVVQRVEVYAVRSNLQDMDLVQIYNQETQRT